jgi:hypothetical protein
MLGGYTGRRRHISGFGVGIDLTDQYDDAIAGYGKIKGGAQACMVYNILIEGSP